MIQFEAAELWKTIQAAIAKGNKARTRSLEARYNSLLAQYPSSDAIEQRLKRMERALGQRFEQPSRRAFSKRFM
jgi:hypothetical protein